MPRGTPNAPKPTIVPAATSASPEAPAERKLRFRTAAEIAREVPGPDGIPVHRPEDIAVRPGSPPPSGPLRYTCTCPHDGYVFIVGPFDSTPDPETQFRCVECRGEYPLSKLIRPKAETVKFFGEPVTCATCSTVYKPKQGGAGAFDPVSGRGGDWRACPNCGSNPPGMPTYNSLEDPNVRQQAIPT